MELNIVKRDKDTLLVECRGETVTLTNLVREYLWDNSSVTESAQIKEHPYLAEPKIWVKVTKGSPVTALVKASESIIKDLNEFKEKFKIALKRKG